MNISDDIKTLFNMRESRRRFRLGVGVADWRGSKPWYYRNVLSLMNFGELPGKVFGIGELSSREVFSMLRRVKEYLAMRSVSVFSSEICERLDHRRVWNRERRVVGTLLDFFPALKYSYSSLLPSVHRFGSVDLVVSEKGKARVVDVARSHSIWLDPVDAPKELFKYRLRINDCISWAYNVGFVPVMVTLTIPHIWNDLDKLLEVLRRAWSSFFAGGCHRRRVERVGLVGYIRRLEITLNDSAKYSENFRGKDSGVSENSENDKEECEKNLRLKPIILEPCGDESLNFLKSMKIPPRRHRKNFSEVSSLCRRRGDVLEKVPPVPDTNNGWHPHFHALLFIPKDNLEVLSDLEDDWRAAWCDVVCRQFEKVIGTKVPDYSVRAMRKYGFWFSRCECPDASLSSIFKVDDAKKIGDCSIRPVEDSEYLAKIMGYDPMRVYGVDMEMTASSIKNSKTFFDLLCDEVTASNCDLVCEYAIATKGIAAVTFSFGLEKKVAQYFESHPDKRPSYSKVPTEKFVASVRREVYQLLYRNALFPQLLEVAAQGYDALCSWLKQIYVELGVPQFCDDPFALPRPPN